MIIDKDPVEEELDRSTAKYYSLTNHAEAIANIKQILNRI